MTDTRKTLGKGRLRSLSGRLTPAQQQKRQARIGARATMARQLIEFAYRQTTPLRRGFLGRMKWLVFGR